MNAAVCIKTGKYVKRLFLCLPFLFCTAVITITAVLFSICPAAAQIPQISEKSIPAVNTAPEIPLKISATQMLPVQYRRWFAPMEHFLDLPLKDGPYVSVKRERFERWLDMMKQSQQNNSGGFSTIRRIILEGKIDGKQSFSGGGIIEFQLPLINPLADNSEQSSGSISILLESWNIWASSPEYEDGTPASFVSDSGGSTQLLLQSGHLNSKKLNKIRFKWSLQSCRNNQDNIRFDFQLPSCPGIELSLQLPAGRQLTSSSGIIIPPTADTADTETKKTETENKSGEQTLRHWRVLLGSTPKTSVAIETERKNIKEQRTTPVRERIIYNVSPTGTDVTKHFFFSPAGEIPETLTLEAESPLKVFDITQNEKPLNWITAVSKDGKNIIQLIPLTGAKTEIQQITVKALAPFIADNDYQLPRIRLNSPYMFWTETRCDILVSPYLRVKKMDCLNGVQTASAAFNQSSSDTFTFQYFQPDAVNVIHISQLQPVVLVNSTSQIQCSDTEVTCNMTLDCSVKDGELYTVRFPVSKEWTVNTLKAVSDDIISWDIIKSPDDNTSNRTLIVQTGRAIGPKTSPLRIQVLGRYLLPQKDSFTLGDLVPLLIPFTPEQTQLIALLLETPKQLKCISPEITLREISISNNSPLYRQFTALQTVMPQGHLFLLDTKTKNAVFWTEQLTPVYSGKIDILFSLQENRLTAAYQFQCSPADSKIDKVYVFFSSSPDNADNKSVLNWNTDNKSFPLQARKLSGKELNDVLQQSKIKHIADRAVQGNIWEIRFPSSYSSPFTFSADVTADIHDIMHLPLAALPFAVQQSGSVQVVSSRLANYQIVNSRLTAVPVSPPKENEYQAVRAAFKYAPIEEFRRMEASPLMLKQISANDLPPSSLIWMQRNNKHYESSGFVRNNTQFFLENSGKENLTITLPKDVDSKNVLAVKIGSGQAVWTPVQNTNEADTNTADGGTKSIAVMLPERQRFVCVSLEYSKQTKPRLKHKTSLSNQPMPDVPVIAAENVLWYPPELDVSVYDSGTVKHSGISSSGSFFTSKAASYQLPDSNFRPFVFSFWYDLFTENFYRQESIRAAKAFLHFLETAAASAAETSAENGMRQNTAAFTWKSLQKKERILSDIFADIEPLRRTKIKKRHTNEPPLFKIMIDKYAFNYYGIYPNSLILPNDSSSNISGNKILEQNHLLLFITVNYGTNKVPEYTFYLTSVMAAAMNRYFDSVPVLNNIRFVPDSKKILRNTTAEITLNNRRDSTADVISRSEWASLNDWIQKSEEDSFPWNVSPQQLEPYSDASLWFAAEIPAGKEVTVYTIRKVVINAEYLLAFLAALVLTQKKPLSSPLFMLCLLLLCEIAARQLPLCYTAVPSGCFLGVLVSFGFIFIRKRPEKKKSVPRKKPADDDSQEYELPIVHQECETEKEEEPTFFTSIFFRRFIPSEYGREKPPLIFSMFITLGFAAEFYCFCSTVSGDTIPVQDSVPAVITLNTPQFPSVLPDDLSKKKQKQEPFRVFYPTDGNQKITGDFVWMPERFFQYLYRSVQRQQPGQQSRWNIERAEYRGVLTVAPLSGGLTIQEFKAVYDIILNENSAKITLPPLPLIQDGAVWDSVPIQPVWEISKTQNSKEQSSAAENKASSEERHLVFNIENERKGRHRLELLLDIKPVSFDILRKVCFDIPKVINTILILDVPANPPEINITNCCGNSSFLPSVSRYESCIGPSGKCSFSWTDNQYANTPAVIEADTLLQLRTRPLQLRAKFRCRIDGGKVNFINLKTDPNWQLSGQYHCDEFPIEHIEILNSTAGKELSGTQQEITRLTFKTAVSGTLTIQAGFVLKDFSGIGNIGLPQIRLADVKTGKAMLAVLDSSTLNITVPKESLTSGFESLWTSALKSGIGETSVAEGTADTPPESVPANSANISQERTIAVYDLTTIPPLWTLSLKTKQEKPSLSMQHYCCFDLGRTTLISNAEFHSNNEVFQHSFCVPESVQISSVSVSDSQNNPVEYSCASISKTAEKAIKKYTIFFKRPLSGQYRITLTSFIPAAETQPQNILWSIFENTVLTEQKLSFYRTSAVIANLTVPRSIWVKQEEKPAVVPQFSEAVFLSSWKEQTAASAESISVQTDMPSPEYPSVRILPNRPSVRSEIITTLYRDTAIDSWFIIYDIIWNISQGELNEIRYFWDEHCGTILAVEPAVQFRLEQQERRLQLIIRPEESSTEKFTGRIHLRIKALFNVSDGIVSVPKIQPVLDDSIRFSSKNYVVLPRQLSDIVIPWNYSSLTTADNDSIEYVKNLILLHFNEAAAVKTSDAAVLLQPVLDLRRESRTETALSSMFSTFAATGTETLLRENRLSSDVLFLQATSDDFTCSITRKNKRPAVTLYDIRFFVSDIGTIFGTLTADIKPYGNDSCILTLPPNSELLQLVSAGVYSESTRLMERRWKINLFSSSYPQRINIIFRCNSLLKYEPQDVKRFLSAVLPVFENADIQETLWSFSFSPVSLPYNSLESKSKAALPLFDISVIQEKSAAADTISILPKIEILTEHFNKQQSLSGTERSQNLLKLDLLRLNNLLFLLDSLPKPVLGQSEEFRNWINNWDFGWTGLTSRISNLQMKYPEAVFAEGHNVLLTKEKNEFLSSRGQNIGELLETMKPAEKSLQALLLRKKYLTANSPETELSPVNFNTYSLLPQSVCGNESAAAFFGAANGSIKEIQLSQRPSPSEWYNLFLLQDIIGCAMFILFAVFFSKNQFSELITEFPHFWGVAAGILLWCFTPLEIAAAAVILLSLFSMLYRPWENPLRIPNSNE